MYLLHRLVESGINFWLGIMPFLEIYYLTKQFPNKTKHLNFHKNQETAIVILRGSICKSHYSLQRAFKFTDCRFQAFVQPWNPLIIICLYTYISQENGAFWFKPTWLALFSPLWSNSYWKMLGFWGQCESYFISIFLNSLLFLDAGLCHPTAIGSSVPSVKCWASGLLPWKYVC